MFRPVHNTLARLYWGPGSADLYPTCNLQLATSSMAQRDHRTGERARISAEVMRQPEVHVLELALARSAKQLIVNLIEHPQPARSYRMPERLQAPVSIDRKLSMQSEGT